MTRTEETPNQVKQWVITIGIFIIVQLVFVAIDGTSLEPNINDSNNLFFRIVRGILDSKLFTEWITPYSYPFFNLCITVHVIAIVIQTVADIILRVNRKK